MGLGGSILFAIRLGGKKKEEARQILNNCLLMLITSPILGITGGCQPIISFNYGAKQPQRVREAVRFILLCCLVFTSFMFVVSQAFPQYFLQIFTDAPAHVQLSVWGIRVFTAAVILRRSCRGFNCCNCELGYILGQLSELEEIRLLVIPVQSALKYMPTASYELPCVRVVLLLP